MLSRWCQQTFQENVKPHNPKHQDLLGVDEQHSNQFEQNKTNLEIPHQKSHLQRLGSHTQLLPGLPVLPEYLHKRLHDRKHSHPSHNSHQNHNPLSQRIFPVQADAAHTQRKNKRSQHERGHKHSKQSEKTNKTREEVQSHKCQ